MKMKKAIFLVLLVMGLPAYAKNIGVYGQVYPIAEPDLLAFIHQRLETLQENGQLAKMEEHFKANVTEHTLRPTPVAGISTASKDRTFYYDPTFIAPESIYNQEGVAIVKAGTKINPFDHMTLKEVLLFINADDPAQIKWVKQQKEQFAFTKIILVQGNIKTASTDDNLGRIYFDQDGILCKKLNITQVPAVVMQSGKKLLIEEVPPTKIISVGAAS